MFISKKDRMTFEIMLEELIELKNIQELNSITESLRMLLSGEADYDGDLLSFLNQFIRTPLYNFYMSDESNGLSSLDRQSIFTLLRFLVVFWPINTNCCITNTPRAVEERRSFRFLSGHVADKDVFIKYLTENPDRAHPILESVITRREILYSFNYKPTILDPKDRDVIQDFSHSSFDLFILAGTFVLLTALIGLAIAVITTVLTGVFPALVPVLLGAESGFPAFATFSSFCIGAYASYRYRENKCEALEKRVLATLERDFRNIIEAENRITLSKILSARTLRQTVNEDIALPIQNDLPTISEEKQANPPMPAPTVSPSRQTATRSPLQANSLLRSPVSNDAKLEQEEAVLEQTAQAEGGPRRRNASKSF